MVIFEKCSFCSGIIFKLQLETITIYSHFYFLEFYCCKSQSPFNWFLLQPKKIGEKKLNWWRTLNFTKQTAWYHLKQLLRDYRQSMGVGRKLKSTLGNSIFLRWIFKLLVKLKTNDLLSSQSFVGKQNEHSFRSMTMQLSLRWF